MATYLTSEADLLSDIHSSSEPSITALHETCYVLAQEGFLCYLFTHGLCYSSTLSYLLRLELVSLSLSKFLLDAAGPLVAVG